MFRKFLYYLDKCLTFFEEWTLFITVVVSLLTLFVSVITRYAMTYTMTWPEELVREVIIYSTFIGLVVAVKNRGTIRADALSNLWPKLAKPLNHLCTLAQFVFAGYITYYGIKLVKLQAMTNQYTITLKIPQVFLYSFLPLMGILMICRLIQVFTEDVTGKPINKP